MDQVAQDVPFLNDIMHYNSPKLLLIVLPLPQSFPGTSFTPHQLRIESVTRWRDGLIGAGQLRFLLGVGCL